MKYRGDFRQEVISINFSSFGQYESFKDKSVNYSRIINGKLARMFSNEVIWNEGTKSTKKGLQKL